MCGLMTGYRKGKAMRRNDRVEHHSEQIRRVACEFGLSTNLLAEEVIRLRLMVVAALMGGALCAIAAVGVAMRLGG